MGVRHEGVPEESIMAPCSLEHCSKHDRFIQSFICLFRESSDHNTFDRAHSTMIASNTHTHTYTVSCVHSLHFYHYYLFIHCSFIPIFAVPLLALLGTLLVSQQQEEEPKSLWNSKRNETKRKPICLTKHSPQEYYTTRARRELDSRILGNLRSQLCVASHTKPIPLYM